MNLCPKMAHGCLRALRRYPDIQGNVETYFQDATGRFGYHASQLAKKHKLPFPLAAQMSAYLNLWQDQLLRLAGDSVLATMVPAMERCVFSYSSLAKYTIACRSKLCPLCRAIQGMKIEAMAASTPWARIEAKGFDIDRSLPKVRTQPGASLTLRNVILVDGKLVLRLLHYFKDPADPVYASTSSRIKACRELLDYDFAILNPEHCKPWLDLVKGLRFFSKSADFAE